MPVAEVQFYDVVKWLHVVAVVVALGVTFSYGVFIAVAAKSAPRSMPGIFAGIQALDRMLVIPGIIVIAATGIYMTIDLWDFGYFFVTWGILAVIVLLVMGAAVFGPNEEKARVAAEQDVERAGAGPVEFSSEFNRLNRLLGTAGPIAGILVIVTVYVMVAKPFT